MEIKNQTYEFAFFVIIKVKTERGGLGELVEFHKWDQMTFEMRMKWNWYFTYRAALLQVKYPRYIVEVIEGKEDPNELVQERIKSNKLRAAKAKITKSINKLAAYKNEFDNFKHNYFELFPIEDTESFKTFTIIIKNAEDKIKALEFNLKNI